jgi:hypothetical protein
LDVGQPRRVPTGGFRRFKVGHSGGVPTFCLKNENRFDVLGVRENASARIPVGKHLELSNLRAGHRSADDQHNSSE